MNNHSNLWLKCGLEKQGSDIAKSTKARKSITLFCLLQPKMLQHHLLPQQLFFAQHASFSAAWQLKLYIAQNETSRVYLAEKGPYSPLNISKCYKV